MRLANLAALLALSASCATGTPPLEPERFEPVNARLEAVEYRGRRALHLVPATPTGPGAMLAIATGSDLRDGRISVDVAGSPRAGAPPDSRGFIGIAFHVQGDGSSFECFYLRPENARSDDQVRRNHTVQYVSHPDFPWHALRRTDPGRYESYADMQTGEWTSIAVEVRGTTARLYVNGASQPALVVNDLKLGGAGGRIALWAHASTDAYFSNLEWR